MTFRWFTSMPTFVAEQISYVADANDLTRLKMFKNRVHDKIAELEPRSMEKFAEAHPEDNENLSRIGKHIQVLSETVKCWKSVMSPDKCGSGLPKSATASNSPKCESKPVTSNLTRVDSKDDLCRALFSDSEDEVDARPQPIKKVSRVPDLLKPSEPKKLGASDLAVRSNDLERLPSTQEIQKVFDNWKEARNNKSTETTNSRAEKRKRSSGVKSDRKTKETKLSRVIHHFDDDDEELEAAMSSASFPGSEHHTSIETDDDGSGIVEQTRVQLKSYRASNIRANSRLMEPPRSGGESCSKTRISDAFSSTRATGRLGETAGSDGESCSRTCIPDTFARDDVSRSTSGSLSGARSIRNTSWSGIGEMTSVSRVLDTFASTSNAPSFGGSVSRVPDSLAGAGDSSNRDSIGSSRSLVSELFDESPSTVASTPIGNSKFKLKVPILSKNLNVTNALASALNHDVTSAANSVRSNANVAGAGVQNTSYVRPNENRISNSDQGLPASEVRSTERWNSYEYQSARNESYSSAGQHGDFGAVNTSGGTSCGGSSSKPNPLPDEGFLDDLMDSDVIRAFDCMDDEGAIDFDHDRSDYKSN